MFIFSEYFSISTASIDMHTLQIKAELMFYLNLEMEISEKDLHLSLMF